MSEIYRGFEITKAKGGGFVITDKKRRNRVFATVAGIRLFVDRSRTPPPRE